jgi:tetratricopeptide (TPR) repeat protein
MAANDSALHGTYVKSAPFVACLCLLATSVSGQENKTVLGPGNLPLHDGAQALMAGDAKEGVKLTLLGLSQSNSFRERRTAKSNLCAGYALLEDYATALSYCDEALQMDDEYWRAYSNRALVYIKLRRFDEAQQDLVKGEAISPNAKTLNSVRKMYRDATDPVAPRIVIDDRQNAESEEGEEDDDD